VILDKRQSYGQQILFFNIVANEMIAELLSVYDDSLSTICSRHIERWKLN